MESAKALTEERGKQHGDHVTTHLVAMSIFDILRKCSKLSSSSEGELFLICVKLSRGVQVPSHKDHWDDIQGYAELIKDTECK